MRSGHRVGLRTSRQSESGRRFGKVGHFGVQNLAVAGARAMTAEPAGRGKPKSFFADNANPVGRSFFDLLDGLDPVIGFIHDAGRELRGRTLPQRAL